MKKRNPFHTFLCVLLSYAFPSEISALTSNARVSLGRPYHFEGNEMSLPGAVNINSFQGIHRCTRTNISVLSKRTLSYLKTKEDESEDKIEDDLILDLIQNLIWLEIRLDTTLASCYALCRFLIYDITTGAKDVPGWQLSDFIMLGGAFSSCIVLSIVWTIAGISTGIFEVRYGDDYDLLKTISTAAIAGPLWLAIETVSGWPPSGVIFGNGLPLGGDMSVILYPIITGTIGLAIIMCGGKTVTSGWR